MTDATSERGHRASVRELIRHKEIVVAPGAFDALSAILIARTGFQCVYLTGNGQSASTLGLPDLGLITLTEMAERVRNISPCVEIPVIADADTGYGSLLLTQRAVREFERSGASAIQIEDQVNPKKCGHELGRELVEIDEMRARIRAAVDARVNPETLVVARTDARTAHGLDEAIRRSRAYADAGADVIFVESPETEDEFRALPREVKAPLMANMVETGRSPYLSWRDLETWGFKIAIYPASAFLAAAAAVQDVLMEIRTNGRAEGSLRRMLTLEQYHTALRFHELESIEFKYRSEGLSSGPGRNL